MEEGMIPSGESGYLRTIDRKALEDTPAGERFSQPLVTTESGAEGCAVNFIRTPPGGGSPEGLHTHLFDQVFYIVGGTMSIQVAEQQFSARAGDVVVFPVGCRTETGMQARRRLSTSRSTLRRRYPGSRSRFPRRLCRPVTGAGRPPPLSAGSLERTARLPGGR